MNTFILTKVHLSAFDLFQKMLILLLECLICTIALMTAINDFKADISYYHLLCHNELYIQKFFKFNHVFYYVKNVPH